MNQLCFCLSGDSFENCCQPFINNSVKPLSAEMLMRSRYSAFCSNNVDYLIDTLSPEKREPNDETIIQKTIDNTKWLGLKIVRSLKGLAQDDTGVVEFIAFYQTDKNQVGQLHESSRFIKKDAQWLYLDGDQLPPVKLSRNDLCFCGSNKKYKKCHGV